MEFFADREGVVSGVMPARTQLGAIASVVAFVAAGVEPREGEVHRNHALAKSRVAGVVAALHPNSDFWAALLTRRSRHRRGLLGFLSNDF